ncbi:CLUMA_CG017440, isoform A [Clunio marinus]|uniref:CLUMA_CG017440, isoform A n=1 Tax=Clunio marinus TaxID=568069 RepID=A0A1J1IVQ4_9DIPT|nr:CLUMA_CG017440, isoform A [Clunio marinus]
MIFALQGIYEDDHNTTHNTANPLMPSATAVLLIFSTQPNNGLNTRFSYDYDQCRQYQQANA